MNILFLSPGYPSEMNEYVQALGRLGVRVIGVGDRPVHEIAPPTRRALAEYLQIGDYAHVVDAVRHQVHARGLRVDRVEALWEPMVLPAAALREALGRPGMDVAVRRRFREKELMKATLRRAGLRVPRSSRESTRRGVTAAVHAIGAPVIVKPIAGAGSADTHRVDHPDELPAVLDRLTHVAEVSVEEFVDGEELTYDTLCVDGVPVYENVAQYLPRPLVSRTDERCSPIIITLRDLSDPALQDGIALGRAALRALGMQTGLTHMEWYRKPSGEVVFGEIGCRPPGAHLVDQMNFSHDGDLFTAWARAAAGRPVEPMPPRSWACAIVFKRAHGHGRIRRVEGLDRFVEDFGEHVVVQGLSPIGAGRRDWTKTLVSDGYLIVRHPDQAEALAIARAAADRVHLYATED